MEILDTAGRAVEVEFVLDGPDVISVWHRDSRTADFGVPDIVAWLAKPSSELASPPVTLGGTETCGDVELLDTPVRHILTVGGLPPWHLSPSSVAGLRLLTTQHVGPRTGTATDSIHAGRASPLHPQLLHEALRAVTNGRLVEFNDHGMIIY